jgi:hypothetical protein
MITMKIQFRHWLILIVACALGKPLSTLGAHASGQGPVKVFILAGQSNMVGDGHIDPVEKKGTLAYMAQRSDQRTLFKHLVDKNGNWTARTDVRYFQRQLAKTVRGQNQHIDTVDVTSPLKPGLQGAANRPRIGPELQFGHVMGDLFDSPVLIIKTAWGGKSLAVDLRPPSAAEPSFVLKANKQGIKPEIGKYYRLMIADIKYALKKLKQCVPDYHGQGYEIVGLGWHQGWNDGCDARFAAEYEENLGLLVKDIRRDIGVRDLPVVIASSGFGGHAEDLPGVRRRIKQVVEPAQVAVAQKMENVTCIPTRDFFRPREESPTGASYHWNSNAETYILIGNAMGQAMKTMLEVD